MARRRSLFKFKLKKQTIYTIFTLLFIATAGIIGASYFQNEGILSRVNQIVSDRLGWAGLLLPIVLIWSSFLFLKLKMRIAKPNVTLGLVLSYLSILGLTQSGFVGLKIWENISATVSGLGAIIILIGALTIGLIVMFNTSLDQIINFITDSLSATIKFFTTYIFRPQSDKGKKPIFMDQKLPIKSPSLAKINDHGEEKPIKTNGPAVQKTSSVTGLPSTMVSSKPNQQVIWEYPPLSLLSGGPANKADRGDMKKNADVIEKTLESFGITARVVEVNLGPAITQYALEIALGTKLSKITALSNDLALALAAPTGQIRIEAPIPGRSLLGIEIPNRSLEFVTLRQMISSDLMANKKHKLTVALGLDVSGSPVTANIAKMPHVLIAGTTGSGKSVLINSWIASLLFRASPDEVRLIMVDPKRVELTGYNGIPHLLTPVIVEPDKILSALRWAMSEMDRRYKQFAEVGVRNIDGFNETLGLQTLPYIVILIDELADLMAYAPVEVEESICRLAQMARATGIHLVIATQRPSVDVITGLIKANVPTRIAFNVSSMIDSRVIIDMPGAEKLLGRGDMLYIPPDQAKPTRIQGTFVSEQDISKLVDFLKKKNVPVEYTEEVTKMPVTIKKGGTIVGTTTGTDDGKDPIFADAVRLICQYDKASASLLQRRFSIGYARAARILDQLEMEGIVGAGEGSKPRDVLVQNAEAYLSGTGTGSNSNTQEVATQ
ncbi:DNA translocase FtsK [Candidatus Gottesmanbacteria bacterium]|nr:DNA translocase FtsK [Candidatus Gottesmanbacteria bacterium]